MEEVNHHVLMSHHVKLVEPAYCRTLHARWGRSIICQVTAEPPGKGDILDFNKEWIMWALVSFSCSFNNATSLRLIPQHSQDGR